MHEVYGEDLAGLIVLNLCDVDEDTGEPRLLPGPVVVKDIEDLLLDPATIDNHKFVFDEKVKKIRIDVGLSTEGVYGARWLVNNDDVGVIGVEANPVCQRELYYCNTNNSYIPSLYLYANKVAQFAGYVSEVFLRNHLLPPSPEMLKPIPYGTKFGNERTGIYHISPIYQYNRAGTFRLCPIVREVCDIQGRYVLIKGAIDNVPNPDEIVIQQFYSTHGTSNIGASSLRKDVIEDDPHKKITKTYDVPCISLKKVFECIDWDKYPFIECVKMDIEGKELDALKSCKEYINKVVFFRVEAFKKDDPANTTYSDADEIVQFMSDNNFELFDEESGDYKFVNKELKELAQENNLSC
tara:strand:+ start:3032 stop:4090 length:1059 start_codon:yes stop_codon:yes gene_type:complete